MIFLKTVSILIEPSFSMSLQLQFAEIQAASAKPGAAKLQNELNILLDDVDNWKKPNTNKSAKNWYYN